MITVVLLDWIPERGDFEKLFSEFDYVHVFEYAIKNKEDYELLKEMAEQVPYKLFIRTPTPNPYVELPVGIHYIGYAKRHDPSEFANPLSFSVHSLKEIPEEVPANTVKVFVSPVFKPISKDKANLPEEEQRKIISHLRTKGLKVIALGGITISNAHKALDLGFDGIALYSEFKRNPQKVLNWLNSVKEKA